MKEKYIIVNKKDHNYPYLKNGWSHDTTFTWLFEKVRIFDSLEKAEKHCEFMNYHLHSDNRQPVPKKYNYVLRKEKLEKLEKFNHC